MTGPAYPFHIDPRDKLGRDEISVQTAFRRDMRTLAPQVMLVGIPNAGRRTQWETGQRAKEGMVPGFPDMMALYRGMACYLEFKSSTGDIKDNQIDTLNALVRQGFSVGVFRSEVSALSWLRGNMPNAFEMAA